jgi:hypothetical protein
MNVGVPMDIVLMVLLVFLQDALKVRIGIVFVECVCGISFLLGIVNTKNLNEKIKLIISDKYHL